MPTLISTPDNTADTWLGAFARAPGSQRGDGTGPRLHRETEPGEREDRRGGRRRDFGGGIQRKAPRRSREPRERAEQRERARARAGQIDEPGAPRLLAFVFGGDREESRERHHLPAGQEGEGVPRDHDGAEAGGEQSECEAQASRGARVVGSGVVGLAVEAGEEGDGER